MNPVITLVILLSVIGIGDVLLVRLTPLERQPRKPRTGAVEGRPPTPPALVRSIEARHD